MFDKEEVVRIIESDSDYSECGEYYVSFINNALDMRYEFAYPCELREALASPEREVCWDSRMTTTTVTVMADDGHHLLVKEMMTDWNGSNLQWWILDKVSLIGDIVWENDDR